MIIWSDICNESNSELRGFRIERWLNIRANNNQNDNSILTKYKIDIYSINSIIQVVINFTVLIITLMRLKKEN